MAGGEGTRLRPLTSNQPKPMISVANKPVLEYTIELLKSHGLNDIILTLQFLPQMVSYYFGSGAEVGVNISYVTEVEPLGTAGSIKNAEEYLKETFLVVSGDALTDIDLSKVIKFHKEKKALATIALKRVENPLEYGIVIVNEEGKVEKFLEKPGWGEVFSDTVNTGIYVLEPEVFNYIPKGVPFDFSKDLFPLLLKEGKPLYAIVVDGYWCDIGNIEQYMKANLDILLGRLKFDPPGNKMRGDTWVGDGAIIDSKAQIKGPTVIGQHVRIEADAKVGEYSIIGSNVVVKSGAHVHRAIVMDNSFIGTRVSLHNCIVGRNCDVRKGTRINERVVIGDECIIGEDSIINHDVKIYPFKTIEAGSTINTSIVWEPRGVKTLFGQQGVSGLTNVDITAELALRLAMAYGSSLPKNSLIVCSRDSNLASRMIKRSIIAGLTASGVNVRDLRICPAPVNRFNVSISHSAGGIHVRTSPFDPQSLQINFFNSQGIDISEEEQRKIERFYFREDFRRAFFNEIGRIEYQARTVEFYVNALLKVVDCKAIEESKPKVVIDHSFGTSCLVMPYLLGKLKCNAISLNAYTDEAKTTLPQEELERAYNQLTHLILAYKADFGILIDSACEKIFVLDDQGRKISPDTLLHLFVDFVCQFEKRKGKIAVPLSVSSVVEQIAQKYNRKVVRTRVSQRSLMEACSRRDVIFGGAQGGGFIFPQFIYGYDAILSFCKLLEYLALAKQPLSLLVEKLPKYYLAHKIIYCSWEKKGLLMRNLIEKFKGENIELLDGIKIFDQNKWVLIIPDPEEPLIRVFAESFSNRDALAKVEDMVSYINRLILS